VLYTVHFTSFCLGGGVFSRTRCIWGDWKRRSGKRGSWMC